MRVACTHARTHAGTRRLYVCKLGWMCNLTHTCSQVSVHALTHVEFIVGVRRLKALSHLIKQKHGMHKYSHKNQSQINTLQLILSHAAQDRVDRWILKIKKRSYKKLVAHIEPHASAVSLLKRAENSAI